jgi:hypothetical protein
VNSISSCDGDEVITIVCGKVYQWLPAGLRISPGTSDSSTNKACCNNLPEIMLKVTLNPLILTSYSEIYWCWVLRHTRVKNKGCIGPVIILWSTSTKYSLPSTSWRLWQQVEDYDNRLKIMVKQVTCIILWDDDEVYERDYDFI